VYKGPGGAERLKAARRQYAHYKRFPEVFQEDSVNTGPNGEYREGYANYLDPTLLDGTLRIRADKTHLLSDSEKRSEAELKINQTIAEANRVVDAAETFAEQGGTNAILGIRFTESKGLEVTAFDEKTQSNQFKLQRLFLGAGIKAIKDRDPSGRLSNEDVGFGKQLAVMMDEGGATLDQLQRAYKAAFGKPGDVGAIQGAAARVFAYIAEDMMLHLDTEISSDVVLSPEASAQLARRSRRVSKYVVEQKEGAQRRDDQEKADEEQEAREEEEAGFFDRALDAVVSPNPLEAATFLPREGIRAVRSLLSDEEE
jgi:hypothetical protein